MEEEESWLYSGSSSYIKLIPGPNLERPACKEQLLVLQRKVWGVWAESWGGGSCGCRGLGVQVTQPLWLARCATGFLPFTFCGLHCWFLQCRHLQFVVVLFVFCCGVCSVGWFWFFFFPLR